MGVWVAVTRVLSEGPKITIVFQSAEGLEAGKTKVHFNGVDIGTVSAIRLAEDHKRVIITAQMAPKTDDFLVKDTQFWVVRPRISGANVTGLGTLISGAYIGLEIGRVEGAEARLRRARDAAGGDRRSAGADLRAEDAGPGLAGYRHADIFPASAGGAGGLVCAGRGRQGADGADIRARAVRPVRQSEHALLECERSGRDAIGERAEGADAVGAVDPDRGYRVRDRPDLPVVSPAEANAVFKLFDNRAEAFEPAPQNPQTYQLIFNQSVRGLTVGAPVEFRGIPVGEVSDIRAQIDLRTFQFSVPVTIQMDPRRLGVNVLDALPGMDLGSVRRRLIDSMVAHGVRAQLQTGNLLTGAVYVSLDFFPGAAPATVDWTQTPPRLPTVSGELEETEAKVENIVKKLDQMPLVQIGDNLQKALAELDLTLVSARGTLVSGAGDAGQYQQSDRAELGPGAAARQHDAGGESRGAVGAGAERLPRTPSRGAVARQEGRAEVTAAQHARLLGVALIAWPHWPRPAAARRRPRASTRSTRPRPRATCSRWRIPP